MYVIVQQTGLATHLHRTVEAFLNMDDGPALRHFVACSQLTHSAANKGLIHTPADLIQLLAHMNKPS